MSLRKDLEICDSVDKALRDLKSGVSIMAGGFGLAGIPETMIEWTREQDSIKDLYFISTEAGDDNWGIGRLYEKGKVRKQSASYIGRCKSMEKAYLTGETELELIPQGTLAEKIRCCGAGIPAFYSRTGMHTAYATGELPMLYDKNDHSKVLKYHPEAETRKFGDTEYILEHAFPVADFAWIKAQKADKMGNCTFEGTAFNFNAIMATAAKVTIVEADEIVEAGELRPEEVQLSGLYVNRLFKGKRSNQIEILKNDTGEDANTEQPSARDIIAMRAAKEFVPGSSCNLGVGIPTLAAAFADKNGTHIFMQSENGMIGVGGFPKKGKENSNWINAGKETVEYIKGASTFGSDTAFAMIRGGHLDLTVLGALETSQYGDIANYSIPGKMAKGMGGAMVSPSTLTKFD